MKLGVAIASDNALPSAFVVMRGLEKSIKLAHEFGYDGVELALYVGRATGAHHPKYCNSLLFHIA